MSHQKLEIESDDKHDDNSSKEQTRRVLREAFVAISNETRYLNRWYNIWVEKGLDPDDCPKTIQVMATKVGIPVADVERGDFTLKSVDLLVQALNRVENTDQTKAKDEGQKKLIAADDILLELGKAVEPEDTPSPLDSKTERTKPTSDREHSPDFRSVKWFGEEYIFTTTQAACVKILWESWEQGTPAISQMTILDSAGSAGDRLRDVFEKGKHPAWGTLITPAGKGAFQLAEREET